MYAMTATPENGCGVHRFHALRRALRVNEQGSKQTLIYVAPARRYLLQRHPYFRDLVSRFLQGASSVT